MAADKTEKKEKTLKGSDLIKKLSSQYGAENVGQIDSDLTVKGMPTGILSLDKTIGTVGGGIPLGKLTEIYGDFATGKSLIGYMCLAQCQQQGGRAVLIDTEYAFNPDRAMEIGLDPSPEALTYLTPETQEEAYEMMCSVIDIIREGSADQPIVVLWDSVASLESKYENEHEIGKANMGSNARVNSGALKRVIGKLSKNNVSLIFINQIRSKLGVMFGQDWDTTGGKAIKFYARLRMHARMSKKIFSPEDKDKTLPIGIEGDVEVTKNCCGAPFRRVHLELMFDGGINPNSGLWDFLKNSKLFVPAKTQAGEDKAGFFTIPGIDGSFSENTWNAFFEKNKEAVLKFLEDK